MMVHSSANVIQATTTSTTRRLGTKDQKKAERETREREKTSNKNKKRRAGKRKTDKGSRFRLSEVQPTMKRQRRLGSYKINFTFSSF
jgi:hypothetical protein